MPAALLPGNRELRGGACTGWRHWRRPLGGCLGALGCLPSLPEPTVHSGTFRLCSALSVLPLPAGFSWRPSEEGSGRWRVSARGPPSCPNLPS